MNILKLQEQIDRTTHRHSRFVLKIYRMKNKKNEQATGT